MRHRLSGRQLGRDGSARKALFRSLTLALVREEQIKTTLPKAKELRRFVERLITIAKVDSTAHRRLVFSRVADAKCVDKLFTVIGPRFAKTQRPGGYTRILKCGFRHSDAAPMAYVIFSDTADLEKIAEIGISLFKLETPYADPHVRCCERCDAKTSAYSIVFFCLFIILIRPFY